MAGDAKLALACTFRLMSDSPKAKIGLTELNLGIIPGWGGTQRLRAGRRPGPRPLDLILFSRRLTAGEAMQIGLVDRRIAFFPKPWNWPEYWPKGPPWR